MYCEFLRMVTTRNEFKRVNSSRVMQVAQTWVKFEFHSTLIIYESYHCFLINAAMPQCLWRKRRRGRRLAKFMDAYFDEDSIAHIIHFCLKKCFAHEISANASCQCTNWELSVPDRNEKPYVSASITFRAKQTKKIRKKKKGFNDISFCTSACQLPKRIKRIFLSDY